MELPWLVSAEEGVSAEIVYFLCFRHHPEIGARQTLLLLQTGVSAWLCINQRLPPGATPGIWPKVVHEVHVLKEHWGIVERDWVVCWPYITNSQGLAPGCSLCEEKWCFPSTPILITSNLHGRCEHLNLGGDPCVFTLACWARLARLRDQSFQNLRFRDALQSWASKTILTCQDFVIWLKFAETHFLWTIIHPY